MALSPDNTVVGFIGTGVMGSSMAGHLMKAGYTLYVYTRSKEKASALCDRGAVWEDTVAGLSSACDVIITMVGFPADVEEVYFGTGGILENAGPDTLAIDMTTSILLLSRIQPAPNNVCKFIMPSPRISI